MIETWVITYLQHYYTRHKALHNEKPPSLASVDSSNAGHTNEYNDKEIKSNRIYGSRITYVSADVNTGWPDMSDKKMPDHRIRIAIYVLRMNAVMNFLVP